MTKTIVLVGDSSGKTTLLSHYLDLFKNNPLITYGLNCYTKVVSGTKLKIWDTTDEGLFLDYSRYIKSVDVYIFVYKVTDKDSLDYIRERLECLSPQSTSQYLIGNMIDLPSERVITSEEGLAFANSHSMKYIEVSAKDKTQSREMFELIVNALLGENPTQDNEELRHDKSPSFKCILFGLSGVGKTSLVHKFISNMMPFDIEHTIEESLKSKSVFINDELIRVNFVDTYATSIDNYRCFTEIDIVILVYSVTDRKSYTEISNMVMKLENMKSSFITYIIIGNKSDLTNERIITYEEAKEFSQGYLGILCEETNAMNNDKSLMTIFQRLIPIAKCKQKEKLRIQSIQLIK